MSIPTDGFGATRSKPQIQAGNVLSSLKRAATLRILLAAVVILQVIMIVILVNPSNIYQNWQNQNLLAEVKSKAKIESLETPVIAVINDVSKLKEGNQINAEVYKDAVNGDYIVLYSTRLIIYRKSEAKVVYDGDPPATIVSKNQQDTIKAVVDRAKALNIVPSTYDKTPQILVVTDPATVKAQNAKFYSNVTEQDLIVYFVEAGKIGIYRPSTKDFVNAGAYQTVIN